MLTKTKVIIAQLGSPKTPGTKDVRSFLKIFLGDPRVVDMNPTIWKIILNFFVLPFRPKSSAKAYSRIWDGEKFPLIENTRLFADNLKPHLDENIELNHAFLLSEPTFTTVFNEWDNEDPTKRADEVVILPQFPQYSEATSASVFDILSHDLHKRVNIPTFRFINSYHTSHAFIDNSVKKIQKTIDEKSVDDLVISFHGIPLRRVMQKKDEYYFQCYETFELMKNQLKNIDPAKIHFTFQSRFGSEQWLGPYTDSYTLKLANSGSKNIAVYCPSFVVDCLETTDEIGNELKEEVHELGCELHHVECLNYDEQWVKDYATLINTYVNEPKEKLTKLFYPTNIKEIRMNAPEQKEVSPPLDPKAKKTLKIVFLTLFLDLIGFSIIFPMFPALAKHYLAVDGDNVFLKAIFGSIQSLTDVGGVGDMSAIVLFGGALGALYSFLQFIAAPIWGGISDRIGRKPVLKISIFGLFVSYAMWFFAGSFTTLILARFIGGIMGGNISTASAVVADVTTEKTRSKGMAFIGIAFAFGFIIGPALGGISSMWDLTKMMPELAAFGVNPFSIPAAIAGILSLINFFFIIKSFDETLPEDKRGKREQHKTANVIAMFKPLNSKGANLTNYAYFLFITAFAGMEFTLTFLAVERLSYTSMDNAYMFIFIGFIIALVQGGYVRRKAAIVGEEKMARMGLAVLVPGLLIIAFAYKGILLYLGLFFLATGSSMAIPTLTSLVSFHTPADEQGHSLGIFRSLGSLGRVIGPILASLAYWKFGSVFPYVVGAVSMIFPILIVNKLPKRIEA